MGRECSDEYYVLDLVDEALGEKALRQHRFDWLLGDPGKSGRRDKLPVDGYWPRANIVVEYREFQHERPVPHFDKPDRLTVSGVQRAFYDTRGTIGSPDTSFRGRNSLAPDPVLTLEEAELKQAALSPSATTRAGVCGLRRSGMERLLAGRGPQRGWSAFRGCNWRLLVVQLVRQNA
ncbi:MAG TPA: hypothetical protein PKD84_11425 [Propionicimonas sp.]|nr:hypothetical protein [Propionicimonas sp.]